MVIVSMLVLGMISLLHRHCMTRGLKLSRRQSMRNTMVKTLPLGHKQAHDKEN
jgi:hypothetical protein